MARHSRCDPAVRVSGLLGVDLGGHHRRGEQMILTPARIIGWSLTTLVASLALIGAVVAMTFVLGLAEAVMR